MVNEINRSIGDGLGERLATSNRQLQEMQEEHRALLLEMETLRGRAAELGRLSAQRQQQRQLLEEEREQQQQQQVEAAATPAEPQKTEEVPKEAAEVAEEVAEEATERVETEQPSKLPPAAALTESADYLQQKLAELAKLKAQFRRVQGLIDTTKLIERHMASKSDAAPEEATSESEQVLPAQLEAAAQALNIAGAVVDPNNNNKDNEKDSETADVLNAMLSMVSEFTSDLRSQAETLKEERDRIKTLKDEILKRRQNK